MSIEKCPCSQSISTRRTCIVNICSKPASVVMIDFCPRYWYSSVSRVERSSIRAVEPGQVKQVGLRLFSFLHLLKLYTYMRPRLLWQGPSPLSLVANCFSNFSGSFPKSVSRSLSICRQHQLGRPSAEGSWWYLGKQNPYPTLPAEKIAYECGKYIQTRRTWFIQTKDVWNYRQNFDCHIRYFESWFSHA